MHAVRTQKFHPAIVPIVAAFAALVAGGCSMQKYRAAPIAPITSAASLEARSMTSAGLHEYFSAAAATRTDWPPAQWNLADLTLAAFYYNPSLQVARERVAEANAAIITAHERPNPTLSGKIGGETAIETPWLASLGFSVPIETAGKRKYRTAEAEKLADVAQWDLAATAWTVRARVRSALIDDLAAKQNLAALRSEERLRAEQVQLYQQRFSAGMIPQPELSLARIQHTQAILNERAAEGRVSVAQAALAAAIGVPLSAIDSIRIAWPQFDAPPNIATLNPLKIQKDAVLNRLDIRRALAAYAAAEAALRLEIARQYPNFSLGPDYSYDEGSHFFSVPISIVLPIFNHNQGPIAEAEARRRRMAAAFRAVQAAGIANSEQALAKYRSALNELAQARRLLQQSRSQEQSTQKSLEAGESDRLALNASRLQIAITRTAELSTLYKTQQALGQLENAVQRPLVPGDIQVLNAQSPMLNPSPRKSP